MEAIETMILMTATTITISDKTRRELLKVGAELQAKQGKKIDYEEVIEYLLAKSQKRPELLRRATSPKGIGEEELRRVLREGREVDKRHEEEIERHLS